MGMTVVDVERVEQAAPGAVTAVLLGVPWAVRAVWAVQEAMEAALVVTEAKAERAVMKAVPRGVQARAGHRLHAQQSLRRSLHR